MSSSEHEKQGASIEVIASAAALIVGGWSALALTQPMYEEVNRITADLIAAVERAQSIPGDLRSLSPLQIAEIVSLRMDYWFQSVALLLYFILVGLLVFFVLRMIASAAGNHKSIRLFGTWFLAAMFGAAGCYALFELYTISALNDGYLNILRWRDLCLASDGSSPPDCCLPD